MKMGRTKRTYVKRLMNALKWKQQTMTTSMTKNEQMTILESLYQPFTPTQFQKNFHTDKSQVRLIVGKPGTGKTIASIVEALYLSHAIPGNRGVMVVRDPRRMFEVIHDAVDAQHRSCRVFNTIQNSNKGEHMILFDNGSMIVCIKSDGNKYVTTLRNSKFGWFMCDSVKDMNKGTHNYLVSRFLGEGYSPCCWYESENRDDIPIWLLDSLTIKGHPFRSPKKEEDENVRDAYKWELIKGFGDIVDNKNARLERDRQVLDNLRNLAENEIRKYTGSGSMRCFEKALLEKVREREMEIPQRNKGVLPVAEPPLEEDTKPMKRKPLKVDQEGFGKKLDKLLVDEDVKDEEVYEEDVPF